MFIRKRNGAVDVVSGTVPASDDQLDQLKDLLQACTMDGQPRIVMNLEGVPLLDSAGLELLLDVRDRCDQRGGAFRLAAPNRLCRDILDATGVGRWFDIHKDVRTAVRSFAS